MLGLRLIPLTGLLFAVTAAAQDPRTADDPARVFYSDRSERVGGVQRPLGYNVLFRHRSFHLGEFRAAVRSGNAKALARIVRDLETAVQKDQAAFVRKIQTLEGSVGAQWWIVNGCHIRVTPTAAGTIRLWPEVRSIEFDHGRRPHLAEATNKSHHASDQANAMKDSKGQFLTGKGVGVGILDTGVDSLTGSLKRPHRCFYPDGNPNNNKNGGLAGSLLLAALKVTGSPQADDAIGHGTAVAGCISANKWTTAPGADDGIAPGAGMVSCNVTNAAGIAADSWTVSGWQQLASLRLTHNIVAANNSFSGAPNLSNVAQIALDSTAYNADMLITVSAGNLGSNTTESQFAYNGIAVGSVDKVFLSTSTFTAIGPLNGSKRTYPDISAIGNSLATTVPDSEKATTSVGGTSYAAGMVCGAAALVRQANPSLSAMAAKAILLDTALYRSNARNLYGVGFMKADAAATAALTGEVVSGRLSQTRKTATFPFRVASAGQKTVTVTWMRSNLASTTTPNLDLEIVDQNNARVVKDYNPSNSYEHVRFNAAPNITYTATVTWNQPTVGSKTIDFAIAGVTNHLAPTLSSLSPTAVQTFQPGVVTITGKNLATVTSLLLDGKPHTAFTVLDDTTLEFSPPALLPIGNHIVQAINPDGKSSTAKLTYTGRKPLLLGPRYAFQNKTSEFELHSDRGWLSLLFVSDSDQPSKLPGIYELTIGSNFTRLIPTVYLHQGTNGAVKLKVPIPANFPKITIYLQALSVNTTAPTYPFPVSNHHPVTVF